MSDAICSVEGCGKPRTKVTWCTMHYWRQHRTGSVGPPEGTRDTRTAWERVDKNGPGGCWLWTGHRNRKGYGRCHHIQAHRWFYQLLVGPIPPGLELDHLCRNPSCVNPEHLEPVTRRENLARSRNPASIGIRFNTCLYGHPFTEENTYWRKDRPNQRVCRTCMKERGRRQAKQKAADPQERESA